MSSQDKAGIDDLVTALYGAFTENGRPVSLGVLRLICVPQTLITRNCGDSNEIFSLEEFIESRQRMFAEGMVKDFREEELAEQTEIFGNVAQRFSLYQKRGLLKGTYIEVRGMKALQFIRTSNGWRICALAWDDERKGLTIPEKWLEKSRPL